MLQPAYQPVGSYHMIRRFIEKGSLEDPSDVESLAVLRSAKKSVQRRAERQGDRLRAFQNKGNQWKK